jgi:FxsC-like protein
MPYFFFSYARGDLDNPGDNDPYLTTFYHDIIQEIKPRIPRHRGEIGFRDEESIQSGNYWSDALANALKTAKVFICIYSPYYFTRPWCGKEWTVFTSRIDKYMENHPECETRPSLMIPVLWRHSDEPFPTCANEIQFADYDLGQTYAKEGLHYIMKLSSAHGEEYQRFLIRLGDKIVQAVKEHPLPEWEDLINFDSVKNAFEMTETSVPLVSSSFVDSQHQKRVGPRYAQFVYVAARADEFQKAKLKQNVDAYGSGDEAAMDWKPYCPPVETRIVIITQKVTTDKDLVHEVLLLNNNLITNLQEAKESNKIVIIIVDPWTLKLHPYSQMMQEYDKHHFFNCTVLVSFNLEDEETREKQAELKKEFERNFFTKIQDRCDSVQYESQSEKELHRKLRFALQRTKDKISMYGEIRDIMGGGLVNKPTVNA